MAKKIKIGPYSAYAIAVAAGYQGTEQEWLASLAGPQGPGITRAILDSNSHLILTVHDPATGQDSTLDAGAIDTSAAVEAVTESIRQAGRQAVEQAETLVQQATESAAAAADSASAAAQSADAASASASAASQSAAQAAESATAAQQDADAAASSRSTAEASAAAAANSAQTSSQQATQAETSASAAAQSAASAQGSAEAASASAQAAQEAQAAAQQALGFRTFFSAVSPDANGDLDPSRPMTTPTAQASWTIKSKGDRIQSVQVNGFTAQAGSGDPSPTNVRKISTAGMRMVKVPLTGNELYSRYGYGVAIANVFSGTLNNPVSYCTNFRRVATGNRMKGGFWFGWNDKHVYCFIHQDGTSTTDTEVQAFKADVQSRYAAGNPVIFWYVPADESQATGLYVPIQSQGHEYRCQCLELTEPLCDGDTVESCVSSGCDKTLTFTGDSEEKWTQNLQSGAWFTPVSDIAAYGSTKIYSDYLPGNTPSAVLGGTEGISPTSGGGYIQVRLPDSTAPSDYLPAHPLTVWYQSTAYTEANDIPVALETHNWSFDNFTSEDTFSGNTGSNWVYTPSRAKDKKTNGTVICSHFKGVSGNSPDIGSINKIAINANGQYVITSSYGSDSTAFKAYVSAQETAGTPVTIVYELATPAIYAHDPVELVAVPYTEADATAANQLAATPSTLPYFDSADVPMLLNKTTEAADAETDAEGVASTEVPPADATNAVHPMTMAAPLSTVLPVAGTYVVSSQNGTTVQVSLKSMQDGGDAATLEGMTLDDIKALISSMIADANK